MTFRLLMLLTLLAVSMFAQPDLNGPVSAHLKAGDFAPGIVFARILNNGSASGWTSDALTGQITVLVFHPDTSHNLQFVSRWNALVERFVNKPIQFVWITGEKESSLLPWLQEHPVKGWVFHDPDGATERAYGIDMPAAVIVGADRRIVGFDEAMIPEQATLTAALDGRVTTVRPRLTPSALKAFDESGLVLLSAEPPRMPRAGDYKPDFPPSYTVHISPAKDEDSGDFADNTFHSFRSFTLRNYISQLYDINLIRIVLPPALDDDKRFDIALVLPAPESQEITNNRILQGIQDYFGVIATREERLSDVYVVTAANGKPPTPLARSDDGPGFVGASFSSVEFQAPQVAGNPDQFPDPPKPVSLGEIRGISLEGTLDDFCRALERALDRPVVNETNMQGEYEFNVKAGADGGNDFLERLRDRFNLNIAPGQRRVQVVVLKPR
jgi:uncharacterized protein (TIGR03435 family)